MHAWARRLPAYGNGSVERALVSVAVDEWRRMCLSASRLDGGVAPRMGQEAQQAAGPSPGMRQHGQAT